MYCKNCGIENNPGDKFCKSCGEPLKETVKDNQTINNNIDPKEMPHASGLVYRQKSIGIALVLSFFIFGVGLIYTGLIKRGLFFLIVGFIVNLLFLPLGVILWIIQMIDTYYAVKQVNIGETPLFLGNYSFLNE